MRATVIVNPISGPRRQRSLDESAALAQSVLGRHGMAVDVRVTAARGDARAFSQEARAAQADVVVAWGGDGTINEVASALAFSDVLLGIVPGGSGNGLARDLGIPLDAARALEVVGTGRLRRIDAGQIDEALFFNVAGIGVDAVIASAIADPGSRRGLSGYARVTLVELPRYRPQTYRIVCEEETLELRAVLIALANSRQYGSGARIAPAARLDDGRLNLVVVEAQPLWRIVSRIPELFRGTLAESQGLRMRDFARATISTDGTMLYHADGEPGTAGQSVEVRVHTAALAVMAPNHR